MQQPFDTYKDEVNYDTIIKASVSSDIDKNSISELADLISNEDFIKIYFSDIALGRVYPKIELVNDELHLTCGISYTDAERIPTQEELDEDIVNLILNLDKNLKAENVKVGKEDIVLDIVKENKNIINNIDKKLINEGQVVLIKENQLNHSFKLTDDGIIEQYYGDKLEDTFPFSKLSIIRKCKQFIEEGYNLNSDALAKSLLWNTEFRQKCAHSIRKDSNGTFYDVYEIGGKYYDMRGNELDESKLQEVDSAEVKEILDNPEEYKRDIQKNIDIIDDIKEKQDELDSKLANLLGESKNLDLPEFPKSEFTNKTLSYSDINLENFNDNINDAQKEYIIAYICPIDEFIKAMGELYMDVGCAEDEPLICIDEYIDGLLDCGGDI